MYRKPELLAPAGTIEALRAAVENGADAVYLGGKMFGARAYASNFDEAELREAVNYCHGRGVKIYITVNTLLDNQEIKVLEDYLYMLYRVGADALIVQDLGVARMVKNLLPEMEIHASTQMTVLNSDGLKLLEEYGFHRVVLAREVTLEDIGAMTSRSAVELEVFIHGALCVCYSGQCLMSSMIGGRSGNRGRCAQPCRLTYTLVDKEGQPVCDQADVGEHLLSPKDIKTIEILPELIKAGIASLKIEGRMKKPEYVATVVKQYRQALDRAYADLSNYRVQEEEERALRQFFNRDFFTGYFQGNLGKNMMSYKRPNNRGILVGRVLRFDREKQRFTVKLEEPLRLGDGIEVWVTQGGRVAHEIDCLWLGDKAVEEASVGQEVSLPLRGHVRVGDRVFKIHDERMASEARETYRESRGQRKAAVHAQVHGREGEPLVLRFIDEGGRSGEGRTAFLAQRAQKRPLTEETLRDQLGRLGNTPFQLAELTLDLEGELMVPVSELNEARRQAVAQLEEARLKDFERPVVTPEVYRRRVVQFREKASQGRLAKGRDKGRAVLSVTAGSPSAALAAARGGAGRIYLPAESWRGKGGFTSEEWAKTVDTLARQGVEVLLALPRLYREENRPWLLKFMEKVKDWPWKGVLAGNLGAIAIVQEVWPGMAVYGDFPLNVFNDSSVDFYADLGVRQLCLSPELTLAQLKGFRSHREVTYEVLVHGAIPLMVTEYCALGSLVGGRSADQRCSAPCAKGKPHYFSDRMNYKFPLEFDEFCRMTLYNAKELRTLEILPEILDLGVASLRIEGRSMGPEDLGQVTAIYHGAMAEGGGERSWQGYTRGELPEALAQLDRLWPAGYTKGHYFRGVE